MNADVWGADPGNAFAKLVGPDHEGNPMMMLPSSVIAEGISTAAYLKPPDGSEIIVYDPVKGSAEKLISKDPGCEVRDIKTLIQSSSLCSPEGISAQVSPYKVYQAIVRDLVRLGNIARQEIYLPPIYDLVFTFPACFIDDPEKIERMQACIEDITLEGQKLHVVGRLPEPAAAAIDYLAMLQTREPKTQEITVLVFDLGEGTLDTALVTARSVGEPYEVVATGGSDVAGRFFTQAIINEFLHQLQLTKEELTAVDNAKLRREAEQAKRDLSANPDADNEEVEVDFMIDGEYKHLTIDRERFEKSTAQYIEEAVTSVKNDLLQRPEAKEHKPDRIVLTGGASQMPMVGRKLKKVFPDLKQVSFKPQTAVASGAMRYGMSHNAPAGAPQPLGDAVLYSTYSYGILVDSPILKNIHVQKLISSGAPLPCEADLLTRLNLGGYWDCCIFRPRKEEGSADTLPQDKCIELIRLHFDVVPGRYSLKIKVAEDYGITVTLTGTNGQTYTSGTKAARGGGA